MKTFLITDFGAVPDGKISTDAIQAAIDACFSEGGGKVVFPAGRFVTGGIRLRSNVTLYLEKNARIEGTRNPEDYMGYLTDKIQPVPEEYKTDEIWKSTSERTSYDFLRKPCGRWSNAIIRAIDAENVAIIGEEGSEINGMNSFDEIGEEHYRGVHGITMHNCKNIKFEGYTIKDTGNWAHALFECTNIDMRNVSVYGGHDGVHVTSCKNTVVEKCVFETGDDCIAGIDNYNTVVTDCELNTACSAFRFGGTNMIAENCRIYGPGKYIFRGSLSLEEKRSGVQLEKNTDHRYNMLSVYTYYADFSRSIRLQPGNIVIRNCSVENADRFLHYNFSGNEPWQNNKPLENVTFENIKATGIRMPLTAYGDENKKVRLEIKGCDISFEEGFDVPFIHAAHFDKIVVKDTKVHNIKTAPFIKAWTEGNFEVENVDFDGRTPELKIAEEKFETAAI